jgi:hypothetical protein
MKWRILPAQDVFVEFAPTSDKLNANLFRRHPLFDSRFVAPLLAHFGDAAVRLAVLDGDGGPEGMLLLQPGRRGVWRLFLPSQAQVAPLLLPPERYAATVRLFAALPGRPFMLEWLCQDEQYTPCPTCDGCHRSHDHALTTAICLDRPFDTYWAERPKSVRQNISRHRRRITQDGLTPRLVVHESPATLAEGLRAYGLMESRGWKSAAGTAIHPDNAQGRFYDDVLQGFARSREGRIYELHVGERHLASRVAIHNGRMLVMLKTTYDESAADLAPGWLLLHEVLAREFARAEFEVIEFYTNATPEQLRWATRRRSIRHVTRYASPAHRVGVDVLRSIRGWLFRQRPGCRPAEMREDT